MSPKLAELITNGALFAFVPLVLLLAVDLVFWSLPLVRGEAKLAHATSSAPKQG